jgi:hypothetical protein
MFSLDSNQKGNQTSSLLDSLVPKTTIVNRNRAQESFVIEAASPSDEKEVGLKSLLSFEILEEGCLSAPPTSGVGRNLAHKTLQIPCTTESIFVHNQHQLQEAFKQG